MHLLIEREYGGEIDRQAYKRKPEGEDRERALFYSVVFFHSNICSDFIFPAD